MNRIYCPQSCKTDNVNRYANTGGGGMTMKKKYASKFNKVSSNTQFSINGINNRNIHSLIGNPNNVVSHDPFSNINPALCKTHDNTIKTSVKNTKALINSKLQCSPLHSQHCYNKVNHVLVSRAENDDPLNKHFIINNQDQSLRIQQLISNATCSIDRTNYLNDISNNIGNNNCAAIKIVGTNRINTLKTQCNITKDMNHVPGYTPGYQIYYNDSTLFTKKKCLHNPPDAKVLAC